MVAHWAQSEIEKEKDHERDNIYDAIGQNPLLGTSDFAGRSDAGHDAGI